jgi:hypothetical protein
VIDIGYMKGCEITTLATFHISAPTLGHENLAGWPLHLEEFWEYSKKVILK